MRFATNGKRKMSSNITLSVPTMIWRSTSIHTMRVRYDDYLGTEDRMEKGGRGEVEGDNIRTIRRIAISKE